MYDLLYVGGTLAFFALMVLFIRASEKLGNNGTSDQETL